MKLIFIFNILFLSGIAKASGFIENVGQLKTTNSSEAKHVLFYTNYNGFRIFLNETGFSYEIIESQTTTNEFNNKQRQAAEIFFNRIDIIFEHSSFVGKVTKENMQEQLIFYSGDVRLATQSFQKITYHEVFPLVDMIFYANENQFKYDFVLKPGALLSDIKLNFCSAFHTTIEDGNISIKTPLGQITERIPLSYFSSNKDQVTINFVENQSFGNNNYFSFAATDVSFPISDTLIIDPMPNQWFGTFISGNINEFAQDVCLDEDENIYVVGHTNSINNIATSGAFQGSFTAVFDVFLVKYKSDGTKLWGTYVGGDNYDRAYGISFANGFLYICGSTYSTNFSTPGVYQTVPGNADDAFLAKFDLVGNRIWSTYFGGELHDFAASVVVNSLNEIYISGHTLSYTNIATLGAHQESFFGVSAAFLAKFSDQGQLTWSTYYGNSAFQEGYGIALDNNENILLTGFSNASSGIASPGAYQTSLAGEMDAFLVKFNPSGQRIWGTYFGGLANDFGYDVCVDSQNGIYLMGNTSSFSGIAFGTGYQFTAGSVDDGFVAKFTPTGALQWSTYIGGSEAEYLNAIQTYFDQGVIIVGKTQSDNAIATSGALSTERAGEYDAFLLKLSTSGELEWGTFYGGELSDEFLGLVIAPSNGYIHGVGLTSSENGIATPDANQTTSGGGFFNGFLTQFCAPFIPQLVHNILPLNCGQNNFLIEVDPNNVFDLYYWNNDSSNSILNLTDLSLGNYSVYLNTIDTNFCAYFSDTLNFEVAPEMLNQLNIFGAQSTYCQGDTAIWTANPNFETYLWSTGGNMITENTILGSVGNNYTTIFVQDTLGCVDLDTLFYQVNPAPFPQLQFIGSTNFCIGETVEILTDATYTTYLWSSGETTQTIELDQEAWVWLYATNEFGCDNLSDSLFISATALTPQIIMNATPPFCPNEPLTFATQTPFDSYFWNNATASSELVIAPFPGAQFVTVEVANLCGGSGVDTFYFDVLPATNLEIIYSVPEHLCVGSSVYFSIVGDFTDIQWQNESFGMNYNTQAEAFGAWQIFAEALDSNFCPVYDTVNLIIENCHVGIENNIYGIYSYPNPTNHYLHVSNSPENSYVKLYDAIGQLILNSWLIDNKIYVADFLPGVYILEIYSPHESLIYKQRIVKK